MLLSFRRLIALLVCLHVWACFGLPTQAAYRCAMMEGSRIAAPCCPTSVAEPHELATIADHCCEELPKPTLDTPGPRPQKQTGPLVPVWTLIQVDELPTLPLPQRPRLAHFPSGVPPNPAPPRRGITVLQV